MAKKNPKCVQNLEEDHREIQNLFRQFDGADDQPRERIANDVLTKLEIHSNLEEERPLVTTIN
jgi:hypothetical protein